MWLSVNLGDFIHRILVEIPFAVSAFLHIQNGGAIADPFPVSHIVGQIGWAFVRPYLTALHHAYVDDIPAHLSGRGLLPSLALNAKCYRPFLRRKPRLIANPIPTDVIVWNLKQRELAVYGAGKTQPTCPPPGPTDVIVWRLEDRELAVYGGGLNNTALECEDGYGVDDWYEYYGDGCRISGILWFALAGGGVASGACCVLATGQGGDKASVLSGDGVADIAGEGTGELVYEDVTSEAVDLSGTTLNDSLIKGKDESVLIDVTGDETNTSDVLPPDLESKSVDVNKGKARCVVEKEISPLETLLTYLMLVGTYEVDIVHYLASRYQEHLIDEPTPLCRFISGVDPGYEHIHVCLGPNPLIKKEFLPPIPDNIFDIVPHSTANVQSMLKKTCVTQNCGVEAKVQTCPQCQVCVAPSDHARRSARLSHFERVDLLVDHTIAVLAIVLSELFRLFSSMVPVYIVIVCVLGFFVPPAVESIHSSLIWLAYIDDWWLEVVFWLFVIFWIDEYFNILDNPYRIGREDELPNYRVEEYTLDPLPSPNDPATSHQSNAPHPPAH